MKKPWLEGIEVIDVNTARVGLGWMVRDICADRDCDRGIVYYPAA